MNTLCNSARDVVSALDPGHIRQKWEMYCGQTSDKRPRCYMNGYQIKVRPVCIHDRWCQVPLIRLVNHTIQNPDELGSMKARPYGSEADWQETLKQNKDKERY